MDCATARTSGGSLEGARTMPTYPTVDESRDRLQRAGWCIGDAAFGPLWHVKLVDAVEVG